MIVQGIIALSAAFLLSGCITAGVPNVEVTKTEPWPTMLVCKHGKDSPHLDEAFTGQMNDLGVKVEWMPLPERYADADIDFMWAAVLPCDGVFWTRLPTGYSVGCVLVACIGGYTRAHLQKVDFVIVIDWGLPHIVRHEVFHAFGCDHGEKSAVCQAKIESMKTRLNSSVQDQAES